MPEESEIRTWHTHLCTVLDGKNMQCFTGFDTGRAGTTRGYRDRRPTSHVQVSLTVHFKRLKELCHKIIWYFIHKFINKFMILHMYILQRSAVGLQIIYSTTYITRIRKSLKKILTYLHTILTFPLPWLPAVAEMLLKFFLKFTI
jgi:hypothetical protein